MVGPETLENISLNIALNISLGILSRHALDTKARDPAFESVHIPGASKGVIPS